MGVAAGGASLGSAPRPPRYGPQAPLKSGVLPLDCAEPSTTSAAQTNTSAAKHRDQPRAVIALLPAPAEQVRVPDRCRAPGRPAASPAPATRPASHLSTG